MKATKNLMCMAVLLLVLANAVSCAQTPKTNKVLDLSPKDSLLFAYLDTYRLQLREPTYELYPTQNIWIFLKLDTSTGAITLVQGGTKADKIFEVNLDSTIKVSSTDDKICGRFKLYPTQNMFNFMMLDQIDGRVWQVQWGFDEKDRVVIPVN